MSMLKNIAIILMYLFLGFYFHWWILGLSAFLLGLKMSSAVKSFFSAFLINGCLWVVVAFNQDYLTAWRTSERIAGVLLIHESAVYLISFAIGAASAGFAAVSGFYFREMIDSIKRRPAL